MEYTLSSNKPAGFPPLKIIVLVIKISSFKGVRLVLEAPDVGNCCVGWRRYKVAQMTLS